MNRRSITRLVTLGAVAALAVGTLAGCAGRRRRRLGRPDLLAQLHHRPRQGLLGGDGRGRSRPSNPGVTIKIQAIQNEDMDGKLQTALNSGDAPDIFMARGGGKLAAVVEAGQVHGPHRCAVATTPSPRSARRRSPRSPSTTRSTACRPPCCPAASTTARTCSTQAGITETPTTFDELERRRRQAQGRRHRADRPRREGRLARRALVLLLRAARVLAGRRWPGSRRTRASTTRAGSGRRGPRGLRRDRAVQRRLPHHLRPAGRRLLRGPRRQPQGRHGAHGRVGSRRDRLAHARREAARRPRLVPLPRRRRRRRRARRDDGRRRRLLAARSTRRRSAPTSSNFVIAEGRSRRPTPSAFDTLPANTGRPGRRHRPRTAGGPRRPTTTRRTSRCGSTRCSARTSATR